MLMQVDNLMQFDYIFQLKGSRCLI